jgi:hypothetical protein
MTEEQVNRLSQLIADQLRSLIWEQVGENRPLKRPANLARLCGQEDQVKNFLMGHLGSMGILK